jgi:hypothetical protein
MRIFSLMLIYFVSISGLDSEPSRLEQLMKITGDPQVTPRNIMVEQMESLGEISGSNRTANYLTNGDLVFLRMNIPVSVGDVFSVYTDHGPLKKSYRFQQDTGRRVQILGEVFITDVKSGWIIGRLRNAQDDIQRGHQIGRLMNFQVQLKPQEPQKPIRGRILGGSEGEQMIGTYRFAFIDKGSQDGLNLNDRLLVMKEPDSINKVSANFPELPIAELIVVHLDQRYSTVYVFGGIESFAAGAPFKSAISEERYLD